MTNDDRLDHGVRRRKDGAGDDYAFMHRQQKRELYMIDLDDGIGVMGFRIDGEDRIFLEYTLAGHPLPDFAYVAFFDRKKISWARARNHPEMRTSKLMYLDLCRKLSVHQPHPIRFFYVCGSAPNWQIGEFDLQTGAPLRERLITALTMEECWQELGLFDLRDALTKWLKKRRTGNATA